MPQPSAFLFSAEIWALPVVMFLLGIGELLEEWTHKKSVGDLAKRTMSLNVGSVWLKQEDGQEVQISANEVKMNDRLVIHMGTVILRQEVIVGPVRLWSIRLLLPGNPWLSEEQKGALFMQERLWKKKN